MKRDLYLKKHPTLKNFQQYIKRMVRERGFEDETIPEIFMMLSEEIGEMAEAARKYTKIKIDDASVKPELSSEIADVFIYLLDLCNHFDIDLEKAFREKEKSMQREHGNDSISRILL